MLRLLPLALLAIATAAAATREQITFAPLTSPSRLSSCPSDPPASCPTPPEGSDSCCVSTGQFLLTQFWDAAPTYGPVDSWTIHGLWLDFCQSPTFPQNCDPTRAYHNITEILEAGGAHETLKFIEEYWKAFGGQDSGLWTHEWQKHGTCMKTLEPICYGDAYKPQEEVVAFFKTTVELFKTLPTFEWLTEAGIVPSRTATYTLEQLQAVARAKFGHEIMWGCQRGWLNEAWYYYEVRGPVQNGRFTPAPATGHSTCPPDNIRWLPKTDPKDPPPPRPTGAPSGKVFIDVLPSSTGGAPNGALISTGKWMRNVTPAGFTSIRDSDGRGFSLQTSKGACAITSAGSFLCQGGQKATTFFADKERNIMYRGKSDFYASEIPSGPKQATIVTGKAAQKVKLRLSE